MYSNGPIVDGSRGLRLPEGAIVVAVSEIAALDDRLLVVLVEEVIELWDEVSWEEELDPLGEEDENPWDEEAA
jgi:DNA-binding transcriptional regulator/RsmH inhibitor MraZ